MRMSKPVNENKTIAISADAFDDRTVKQMMEAMEAFMAADFGEETAAALTQRAA
jgi:hypothetical protein